MVQNGDELETVDKNWTKRSIGSSLNEIVQIHLKWSKMTENDKKLSDQNYRNDSKKSNVVKNSRKGSTIWFQNGENGQIRSKSVKMINK